MTEKTSTMEEFEQYAELLDDLRSAYMELLEEMSGSVPKSVYGEGLDKIDDGEMQLRSDLEDRMAEEHPVDWSTDVFYGGEE